MAKQRNRIQEYQQESERQADVSGRWDPSRCTKECYDYEMRRMPAGAIAADMTKHAPHNSYGPLFWYQDRKFTCVDCGRREVWAAEDQQWWYEVARGPIYSKAIRCRACRKARRASHGGTPRRSQTERGQG